MRGHFDKMSTIPGRPEEFVFLLGVTNLLYYSSLPPRQKVDAPPSSYNYSNDAYSQVFLNDVFVMILTMLSLQFIFGSPVIQISSHSCRITALSVCCNGKICATGDERGGICLLRLLDIINELPITRHIHPQVDPTHDSEHNKAMISRFTGRIDGPVRVLLKGHNGGPIFSLVWLSNDSADLTSYGNSKQLLSKVQTHWLASGSLNQMVCIWCVSINLEATLMMTLPTVSTHILCLHSFPSDRGSEIANILISWNIIH